MPLQACLECGVFRPLLKLGRCEVHAKSEARVQAKKRGTPAHAKSRAWKGLSTRLRAEQPWCSECGTQGSERNPLGVDHLVPLSMGGDLLPQDEELLQVLCRRCNSEAGHSTHKAGALRA